MNADLDFARLSNGKEISRPRKRKNVINDRGRSAFKNQLVNGNFTPWENLVAISNTIEKNANDNVCTEDFNYTDSSEAEDNSESTRSNICVICLKWNRA